MSQRVKSARWFSTNESIKKHKDHLWALKLILKYHSKTEIQPEEFVDPYINAVRNPQKEIDALKSKQGLDLDENQMINTRSLLL